jgi:glucose/arabinose dehydrogenase
LLSALLLLGGAFCLWADNYAPGTIELTPQIDLALRPVAVERLPGRTLNLPPGFKVTLFSAEVDHARFMAFDDRGVLHVANFNTRDSGYWSTNSKPNGTILAMPDPNQDGCADHIYIAADGFYWPHSAAFYQGALYVADHDMIYKLRDLDHDGYYEEREEFIAVPGIMGRPSEHVTHSLLFDKKNDQLYLHVGSGCDLCREDDPERATVLQFNADGSNRRIYASGLRNAIGLDLHPVTGELWAAGNGHDREGMGLPPEWINIIRNGSFHGWPLAYAYRVWVDFLDRQYAREIPPITGRDSALVNRIERPVALVGAHLAPMALHFYRHEQFPTRYKNAAFVAFHAGISGNVDPGYKISVLFSNNDGSNARIADFLTGFRPAGTNSYWAQPVGLATDAQGHLYVSSDRITPGIFRIEYAPEP